jgi:ribosomal protein S10
LREERALADIELKGTDTKDLDKISDQALGYKNNHTDCVYGDFQFGETAFLYSQ